MIKIVSDSSCDIRYIENCAKNLSIEFVPLKITIDNIDFVDDENLDIDEMYKEMSRCTGKSSTTCPCPDDYEKAFEGADEIYVITISSNLSGSYNTANIAKQIHLEKHPNKKIHIFDSLSTSGTMSLLIYKINELVNKNKTFEYICEKVEDYKIKNTHLVFVLHSVDNLVRNGRLNRVIGAAISALGIKIVGRASEIGTLEPFSKVRAISKVYKCFINEMEKMEYKGGKVVISHANNEKDALEIKNLILEKYNNAVVEIIEAKGLVTYYAQEKGVLMAFEY